MFALETPRLILAAAPLPVIKTRLQRDDFIANVPVSLEEQGEVGQMTLLPVQGQPGTVELGYGVNPSYRGKATPPR